MPQKAQAALNEFDHSLRIATAAGANRTTAAGESKFQALAKDAYDTLWSEIDRIRNTVISHEPRIAGSLGREIDDAQAAAHLLVSKARDDAWTKVSQHLAKQGVLPFYSERAMPTRAVALTPAQHKDHVNKLKLHEEGGSALSEYQRRDLELHNMNPGMYYAAQQGDRLAKIHMQYRYPLQAGVTPANYPDRLGHALNLRDAMRRQLATTESKLRDARTTLQQKEAQLTADIKTKSRDAQFMEELSTARNTEAALNRQANKLRHIDHSIGHAIKALEEARATL